MDKHYLSDERMDESETDARLTGPDTFYMFMTQIDDGRETTVEEYAAEVGDG